LKKFILMASLMAVVVAALALPALAHERFSNHPNRDRLANSWSPFEHNNRWDNWWNNHANNWWDNHNNNDNGNDNNGNDNNDNNNVPAVSQSNEQQVQSGDSTQSFNVSGGGANSNQCVGIQGISNTGNAVNNTSVLQDGSNGGEVEVDNSGNFTISPNSTTTCNQKVDQSASASGW
jgi:hypothetical protein